MNQHLFEARIYADLRRKYDLADFCPITAGLSGDKKYCLETTDGRKMLLRVSDRSEHDRKKSLFDRMKQAAERDVPMCAPLEFSLCDNGKFVYQLLTWCDGENLETILPLLPETQQYVLGLQAGEILHTLSLPAQCISRRISPAEVDVKTIQEHLSIQQQIELIFDIAKKT